MDRLIGYARDHRKNPTEAEKILWQYLRCKRLGFRVTREKRMLGKYLVDFYVGSASLAIEVDGGYHNVPKQKARDAERTAELNEYGIKVIRFTNDQVLNSMADVLDQIKTECEGRSKRVRWKRPHVATMLPDMSWKAPQKRSVMVKSGDEIMSSTVKELVGYIPNNVVVKISWYYRESL